MRLVIQRVSRARVTVEGRISGEIDTGLVTLVGVRQGDTEAVAEAMAQKAYGLRIFGDAERKMSRSTADVGGSFLAISQFTLYADTSRGRRPSFVRAADPDTGKRLYQRFVSKLMELGARVQTGEFGAMMLVESVNDGPVTILIDSDQLL